MSWWTTIAGGVIGFMLGGPLGALLGASLGKQLNINFDDSSDPYDYTVNRQERIQAAFFTATFSVMGHVAKADGVVTPEEIRFGESVMAQMNLSAEQRRAAIELYRQGKSSSFRVDEVVEQFRYVCHRRTTLLQMFLEIQLQAAYADGKLHPAQETILRNICHKLHFSNSDFAQMKARLGAEWRYTQGGQRSPSEHAPSLRDAYALLNVSADSSTDEIKRAYRRLMSQHHPDKLASKGLPDEMIKIATLKTQEIRKAYEKIKAAKGF